MSMMFFSDAVADALRHEMERDSRVFVIGEDVGYEGNGPMGATKGLYARFGKDRVLDTPISESAFTGLAAGAALTGMVPVAELMYNDFMGCCMDILMNQIAKFKYMYGGDANVPLTLRITCGGGMQCAAQHSQSLEALLTHIPGLKVVFPSNSMDARGLLISAIRDNDPVMVFEHQMLYGQKFEVEDGNYEPIPLGKADIKRVGNDVTIVATGYTVGKALKAAEKLAKEGINCEVVDPRSLFPLDKETIYKSIAKTGQVVIATEEVKRGAWGGELAACIAEDIFESVKKPIIRVNSLNVPVPFSTPMEDYVLIQPEHIVAGVKKLYK